MKYFKSMAFALLFMILGVVLGACAETACAEQTHPLKIYLQNKNGKMEMYCIIDEDTGVNYIVVCAHSPQGNSVSVTPRLNSDGSLYISK